VANHHLAEIECGAGDFAAVVAFKIDGAALHGSFFRAAIRAHHSEQRGGGKQHDVALGALAGYALARLPVKRKRLILIIVLAVSMFPPIATVSPLYLMIRGLGWRDTYLALIFPYSTFALPLAIWILTKFPGRKSPRPRSSSPCH
jgi:hypothetical protein